MKQSTGKKKGKKSKKKKKKAKENIKEIQKLQKYVEEIWDIKINLVYTKFKSLRYSICN